MDKEEITKDQLNQLLAVENALTEDFCQLSLNALSSTDNDNSIKLKTLVKDKVMLTLLDSRSSHRFISFPFVQLANLSIVPTQPRKVKLTNVEWMTTIAKVFNLEWYIQRHRLYSDVVVMDMSPYDAILGYDWLKKYSPMECDWNS